MEHQIKTTGMNQTREKKTKAISMKPHEEYIMLKELETFYWDKITAYWLKHRPENQQVVMIPILKQQKKLNNVLHKICSDLGKYKEIPEPSTSTSQATQMEVQPSEEAVRFAPFEEQLSCQVPPPEELPTTLEEEAGESEQRQNDS
jgi:hypothetical protein